jgi:hypothetical protein
MNDCHICGQPLDWSSTVGEYDLRQWFIGKAFGEKGFICETCLVSIIQHIAVLRRAGATSRKQTES